MFRLDICTKTSLVSRVTPSLTTFDINMAVHSSCPVCGTDLLFSHCGFFCFLVWSGTEAFTGLLMMDDDECGAVGRMIGRGNRSTRRKTAPVTPCLSQIHMT
jgi:hypothetical protein